MTWGSLPPGVWAEKEVEAALKARSLRDSGFAYHRYSDSKAAHRLINRQPADFLVVSGMAYHLEVKETKNPLRLQADRLSQYGLLKWFWLAGLDFRVLVYRITRDDWYVLSSDVVLADPPLKSYPFDPAQQTYRTASEAIHATFI